MRPISFLSAVFAFIALGGLGVMTLIDTVNGPGTPRQEREAKTPDIPHTVGDLRQFVGQVKHHVITRYALKDIFLRANAAWKTGLLRHADTPDVLLGQEGFLYLASQGTIDLAQGQKRLSDTEKNVWRAHFERTQQSFQSEGLPYALVIGPNKHSIYPDHLPEWVTPADPKDTRSQDVIDVAASVFGTGFVDLRAVLRRARNEHTPTEVYHPTDTHWNELGAALAVQAVFAQLGLDLSPPVSTLSPLPRSGDLSRMLGTQSRPGPVGPTLPKGWVCHDADGMVLAVETIDPLMPRRFTCGSDQGRSEKVIIFTDSFGVSTIPYLATRFQHVEYLWTDQANPKQARDLRADFVLQILVERKLGADQPEVFLASGKGS